MTRITKVLVTRVGASRARADFGPQSIFVLGEPLVAKVFDTLLKATSYTATYKGGNLTAVTIASQDTPTTLRGKEIPGELRDLQDIILTRYFIHNTATTQERAMRTLDIYITRRGPQEAQVIVYTHAEDESTHHLFKLTGPVVEEAFNALSKDFDFLSFYYDGLKLHSALASTPAEEWKTKGYQFISFWAPKIPPQLLTLEATIRGRIERFLAD